MEASLPTSIRCKTNSLNGTCYVKIETVFLQHKEKTCYIDGEKTLYPQAVVGWSTTLPVTEAFCGLAILEEDTGKQLKIPIKAKMDLLVEKTKSERRTLVIFERHYVREQVTYESKLKEVTVNIVDSTYGSKTCISRNDPHMESFDEV